MTHKRKYNIGNVGTILAHRDGGWRCHYCHCEIHPDPSRVDSIWKPRQATVDHKTPLSRGGADSLKNLVLACRPCNEEKGEWDYTFFRAMTRGRRLRVQI